MLALLAPLLASCGGGDSSFYDSSLAWDCSGADPFSSSCTEPLPVVTLPPLCNGNDTGVIDGCGNAITAVDLYDPVAVNLTGLTADTWHTIEVADPVSVDISPPGGYSASSDKDGNIYMATVVQNNVQASGVGTYTVTVKEGGITTVKTLTYAVEDRSRIYCSDVAGTLKASFTAGANVYAKVEKGGGSLVDGTYDLYVISDQQTAIPDGAIIPGVAQSITVTAGAVIADLGAAYTSGRYDVIVDIDGNGYYNLGTDLISRHNRHHPCFAIQTANSNAPQPIASDRRGNKREIFDPDANVADIRDVYGFNVPSEVSAAPTAGYGDLYVVAHQDTWANLDLLTDVTSTVERNPIQDENNSEAKWLLWNYTNLAAGCYDIVVDNDHNGSYTAGTDYVDNTNHLGDNTDCGLRVSTPGCTNTTITSHTDGLVTASTAINLAGAITPPGGQTLTASNVVITSGTQSNTINLGMAAAGGNYTDVLLPLYSGDNHITVSGVFSDNTSCSETITVTSSVDLALFRAQLTWDGDTDMDLHVVRPGGAYSNGGGGDGDCNWLNCKVGLDGVGTNSISWGDVDSELDDPRLDVDCVDCGNGIENIWMNRLSEDGVYTVYVDAFSGSETNVTVSVYILGTAVGLVNCGSMTSDDLATDSCRVGTITWRGGTSGGGYFTPDGTLAATF
jgi:hypothetical protein